MDYVKNVSDKTRDRKRIVWYIWHIVWYPQHSISFIKEQRLIYGLEGDILSERNPGARDQKRLLMKHKNWKKKRIRWFHIKLSGGKNKSTSLKKRAQAKIERLRNLQAGPSCQIFPKIWINKEVSCFSKENFPHFPSCISRKSFWCPWNLIFSGNFCRHDSENTKKNFKKYN